MKYIPELPILDVLSEIKENLEAGSTLILHAPPGAGKSTLLPLLLKDAPWLQGKKILMLEPRRLAASSIAYRMADLLGEKAGETVGYRIRFDNKVSRKTIIEVITEGILTRIIHGDNALEGVGMVIFDEFHERSIHADLALALCKEIQKILRPDLRILVMSATLDSQELVKMLRAPLVESKGKQYPVTIKYGENTDLAFLPEMVGKAVREGLNASDGDILVFLPGQGEIKKTAVILKNKFPEAAIIELYGSLPFYKQRTAILPHPTGKRKIVLATSIAETSLTIEGIKIVIDSGFTRISQFDPRTSLNRLNTLPITQDAADQRAGRAGRLSPGICYRLWSMATQEKLLPYRSPEILEADLTPLALELAKWGATEMSWLTPPPEGNWKQALATLKDLGAIQNGKITNHGEMIHSLPCHPRMAHMLLLGKALGEEALATDLAAVFEEKDPLLPPAGLDINLRIEALRRFRHLSQKITAFEKIEKIASVYRKIIGVKAVNDPIDPYTTGMLLARAFPERIAFAKPGNRALFQLANGKMAQMDNKDELAQEPWITVAHVDDRQTMGKIFMASPLDPKDLKPLVNVDEKIKWDGDENRVIAKEEWRIGQIILQSKNISRPDQEKVRMILMEEIKRQGERLLNFDEMFSQWQNRISSLSLWNPEESWPQVGTEKLLKNPETWLGPYLDHVRSGEDLRKINLLEVLHHHLSYTLQQKLKTLAPQVMELPSGSEVKLQYASDGSPPILAARLQELFGWKKTPTINENKTPVLIHLLSPGFKPVQVTQDLESFWNHTYFEVKKEMQRRYPKHFWPDNPHQAQAVRGVKKKNTT